MPSSSNTLESIGYTAEGLGWKPSAINSSISLGIGKSENGSSFVDKITAFTALGASDWPTVNLDAYNGKPEEAISEMEDRPASPMASLWLPQDIENYVRVFGENYTHNNPQRLPPKVKQIYQNASQIVKSAESRAREIIAQAESKADEIIRAAEIQANEVKKQSYSEGLAASNAETETLLTSARAIVDEVQEWKNTLLEQGEMMMLRLVIEIAQTIFGDGLPLDPDTLGQAFSRVLSQARNLGDLRIYVHPDDAIALSSSWSKMQTSFSGQKIELVPSEVIKRGGCYIDGQFGTIDARVETQLDIAKDSLLTTMEKSNGREK
jgi:flagellar assembly protein FliH